MGRTGITNFTEGNIPRHLIYFSTPLFLGNLLQALYNTVDSIWVGQFLGPEALAAVSVSFPIMFALVALIMGVTMATSIQVSQYYGAGKMEMVQRVIANSLLLLGGMGVVVSVLGFLIRRPLLSLVNVPPDVIDMASSYLGIIFAGMIMMFLYNITSAILRGLGDSRTPLKLMALATGFNILLDPVFIFGLGPVPSLGVGGAALATVLAQGVASLAALKYLLGTSGLMSTQADFWRLDKKLTWETIRIGMPAGVQHVLMSLGMLAVSAIINRFGSTVVAGFGAANRFDQFAFMPAMSVGIAVSTLVGQNLGAGRVDRVQEVVRWSTVMTVSITGLVALAALLSPQILLRLFTSDQGVLDAGSLYLRYMAFAYIPMALMFSISGVLRGAGDTKAAMVITLASLWLVRVPLAAYLSSIPTLGVEGVWIASVAGPILGFLLYFGYYKTGRWENKVVVRVPGDEKRDNFGEDNPSGPGMSEIEE